MNLLFKSLFTGFFLLLLLDDVESQVTIGSTQKPNIGALLDIKSINVTNPTSPTSDDNITSNSGGVVFPRVKLQDSLSLAPLIINATTNDKITHTGLTVYNINTNDPFTDGLYSWNGRKWILIRTTKTTYIANGYALRGVFVEDSVKNVMLSAINSEAILTKATKLNIENSSNLLNTTMFLGISLSNNTQFGYTWNNGLNVNIQVICYIDGSVFYQQTSKLSFPLSITSEYQTHFVSLKMRDLPTGNHTIQFKAKVSSIVRCGTYVNSDYLPYYIGKVGATTLPYDIISFLYTLD